MANRTGLGFSPLTGRIYWGLQNDKGVWVGNNKKDVTNEFLQVMEHKFPVGYSQNIVVNGVHHSTISNIEAGCTPYVVKDDIECDWYKFNEVVELLGVEDVSDKEKAFIKYICRLEK